MTDLEYNSLGETESPLIILSTPYHKHLGNIENVTAINISDSMASYNEISFDVYRESDGRPCALWDDLKDFRYVYVPAKQEYYEIAVSLDEAENTVKHVTGKSASACELSQRILRNLEINTEEDIKREDYKIPTVFYNPDHPEASLLHRVLADKASDYTIAHVDKSLINIQRTFSVNNQSIYDFLTGELSTELGCLASFDSVHRSISFYDLMTVCEACGHRGEYSDVCPNCGNTNLHSYGKDTSIFISAENYADLITVEGDADSVKTCFKIEGGDELITATAANINPNGSNYIYSFSDEMLADMPTELKAKIKSYNTLYDSLSPAFLETTESIYKTIDEELYLTSEMMPSIELQDTTAEKQLANIVSQLNEVAVTSINAISNASADLAVKGMANVIADARYSVSVISSTLTNVKSGTYRTWKGILRVVNNSDAEDAAQAVSEKSVKVVGNNYEEYLHQKIMKTLDKDNACLQSIFEIEDLNTFKAELKKYCLDSLTSFESSYQKCLEVLIENGVTTSSATFYDVDLYHAIYVPYYNKLTAIQKEMTVREREIQQVQAAKASLVKSRTEIQSQLNFKQYIGDLWDTFCLYLREDTYTNDNYISDGLSNSELIEKAKELFETAQKEAFKACRLQVTLTSTLNNLLAIEAFKPLKTDFKIGNMLRVCVNETVYKLRLIHIGIDYDNTDNISVTFSNVNKIKDGISDVESIWEQTKSIASSFDYVAHQAKCANEAGTAVNSWIDKGLDASAVAISNGKNQNIVYDEHGLVCRQYDDILDDYSPEQLKIINNMLAITDNNWETVKAAIGNIYYQDPENGVMKSAYGVIADVLVGKLILGEALGIYNNGGNLKFTENGLEITNGINTFKVNPNDHQKLFSISNQNGEVLYVDNKGNGVFKGEIYATSGEFTGAIKGGTITGAEINNGNGTFKVSKNGKLTASDGEFTGAINATSLNVRSEITNQTVNTMNFNTQLLNIQQENMSGNAYMWLSADSGFYAYSHNNAYDGYGAISIQTNNKNDHPFLYFKVATPENDNYTTMDIYKTSMMGGLVVAGTKSRKITTNNYNDRLLYCYEMPSPLFGDIGHAVIGSDGLCYIDLESVFEETIASDIQYYVFLQAYNEKQPYVLEKFSTYFVVKGDPNTEFDWEVKAKQKDYTFERLEEFNESQEDGIDIDYEVLADIYLQDYEKEIINEYN